MPANEIREPNGAWPYMTVYAVVRYDRESDVIDEPCEAPLFPTKGEAMVWLMRYMRDFLNHELECAAERSILAENPMLFEWLPAELCVRWGPAEFRVVPVKLPGKPGPGYIEDDMT